MPNMESRLSSLINRLKKLEFKMIPEPTRIHLTVVQDKENPDLYHQNKPGIYWLHQPEDIIKNWTRLELDALPDDYQVVKIGWAEWADTFPDTLERITF